MFSTSESKALRHLTTMCLSILKYETGRGGLKTVAAFEYFYPDTSTTYAANVLVLQIQTWKNLPKIIDEKQYYTRQCLFLITGYFQFKVRK